MTTITPLPTPPSRSDPSTFAVRADGFLGALPQYGAEMNAVAAEMNAAAQSALNAPGTSAQSTTSLLVGTGSKSLTITTGKAFVVGQFVMIASRAAPDNAMYGQIATHNSGTGALTVLVSFVTGSGSAADWNVAIASPFDPSQFVKKNGGNVTVSVNGISVPAVSGVSVGFDIDTYRFTPTSGNPIASYGISFSPYGDLSVGLAAYGDLHFFTQYTRRWSISGTSGHMAPATDNAYSMGVSSLRITQVFAVSGSINTSDAREKLWRGALTAQELAAGRQIIAEVGVYQWIAEVAMKGADGARLHIGVRAQQVWSIMGSHGLIDPILPGASSSRYAFLCYDSWDGMKDDPETGQRVPIRPPLEPGDRYGIRPDELLYFLLAAQEQRTAALESRIAALEAA